MVAGASDLRPGELFTMQRMPARPVRTTRTQSPKNEKLPRNEKLPSGQQVARRKSASKKAAAKKPPAKKPPAPAKRDPAKRAGGKALAPQATPARDARQVFSLKQSIKQALTPRQNDASAVDSYLRQIDHPFRAEMEAVRAIIVGVSERISERIKWNAPSFFYKEDLGAFNPRATAYAHLILLFPGGEGMDDKSGLLEGNHKDRREAKFHNLDDVRAKKPALEKLVEDWIALRDR